MPELRFFAQTHATRRAPLVLASGKYRMVVHILSFLSSANFRCQNSLEETNAATVFQAFGHSVCHRQQTTERNNGSQQSNVLLFIVNTADAILPQAIVHSNILRVQKGKSV